METFKVNINYFILYSLHFQFQFLKHILLCYLCCHVNIVFSWCVCVVGHYHCVIEMIAFTCVFCMVSMICHVPEELWRTAGMFDPNLNVMCPNNRKTSNCTNISFSDFSCLSDPRVACSESSSAAYWTQYFCCEQ